MNRKIYSTIFTLLSLCLLLSACKKDYSTLDVNKIPGIVIDRSSFGSLSVLQFDTLRVNPTYNTSGRPLSEFEFEWKINLAWLDTNFLILGNEPNLRAQIRFRPTSANNFHELVLTVTDKVYGIKTIESDSVFVLNAIGEGLVIAHSTDGVNTDIDHLMHPWFTSGFSGESLKRNVFSNINGSKIEGIVKQLKFYRHFRDDVVSGITDNSIFLIKTLDYTMSLKNNDLFFAPRPEIRPQALGSITQGDLYVGEGTLTGVFMGASAKYPNAFDFNFQVPAQLALNPFNDIGTAVRISFYDELNQHFVYMPTIQSFGDRNMRKTPAVAGGVFDPSNLPNLQNLAAGLRSNRDFLHILKNKTTGAIQLYILDPGVDAFPQPIAPAPKALIDLSTAPGIANATHFEFAEDQDVIYYASGNKVYAILYGTSTLTVQERLTLPAGESVTVLQIYKQGNYPFTAASLGTNLKVLMVATNNAGNGKLTFYPMINLGIGNLDVANSVSFTGFGRISAITAQK